MYPLTATTMLIVCFAYVFGVTFGASNASRLPLWAYILLTGPIRVWLAWRACTADDLTVSAGALAFLLVFSFDVSKWLAIAGLGVMITIAVTS